MGVDRERAGAACYWFAVYGHPDGPSSVPVMFEDREGRVYDLDESGQPSHRLNVVGDEVYPVGAHAPHFVIRGRLVYTTESHPFGAEPDPWFEIRDAHQASD